MTKAEHAMRDDEFESILQQAFLDAFPNPERAGCPGDRVLKALAESKSVGKRDVDPDFARHLRRPSDGAEPRLSANGSINESVEAHVAQCSPCTKQLLEFREQNSQRRQTHWFLGAVAASIAAALVLFAFRESFYRPNIQNQVQPAPLITAKLDFRNIEPETRRASGEPPVLQTVPAKTQELAITLPVGSEPGDYELEIRPSTDQEKGNILARKAVRQADGSTTLKFPVSLALLPGGTYVVNWRHSGEQFGYEASFVVDH